MNTLSLERFSACAIFLCVVALGYFYDWRFQYGDLMQARVKSLQLQLQINTMQQTEAQLAYTQTQYNLAKKTMQHVAAVFLNIKNFNRQLQTLIQLGERQGVTFVKIKPSSIANKNFYQQIQVEFEIESYQQPFLYFLQQAAATKIMFTWGEWKTRKYSYNKWLAEDSQDLSLFRATAIFYYI
jgi:Tfp pilus assembly protein PilO